jgi:protein tyrosine/serine phosphatase
MAKNKQHGKTLIVVALVVIAIVGLVRHFHIKNFHVVEPGVLYTSGQPRNMDYTRLLYKYHIATFINVREASEHREQNWYNEELTWMRENGVNYVELPVERKDRTRQFPDVDTQKKFLQIMANPQNLPVLVHGSSGRKRESILTALWLIKAKGYSTAETIKVVEKIKEHPVTEAEREFIEGLAE